MLAAFATAPLTIMVTLAVSPGVCVSSALTACIGMAVGRLRGDARFVGGITDVDDIEGATRLHDDVQAVAGHVLRHGRVDRFCGPVDQPVARHALARYSTF